MDINSLKNDRKEVARYMRRLYKRGLTTASGGNISIKAGDYILITPSAIDKGTIKASQIGVMTMSGENITPDLKPSIESGMHLAIYNVRSDVKAIVHAHPTVATSFTAMKLQIDCTLIAEARMILGQPVNTAYRLMGTKELASETAKAAESLANVIMLKNHGVVCLGDTLISAFDRIEVLEAAAKMTLIARLAGNCEPLNDKQLAAIDRLMG